MRAVLVISLTLLVGACTTDEEKQRHFDNASRHLEAQRFPDAIIEFRNALKADENWGEARLRLGDAYAATEQPELALAEYVRAADLLPDHAEAQIKAGTYLLLGNRFEDAESRARRAAEIAPESVDARIVLANALAGLRDLPGALDQLQQAIAADPARSQPYTALARLHVVEGRQSEAMAAYEAALRLEPTSVPAHLALASFQWSTGDLAATRRTLARAYELNPTDLVTNRVLATFHLTNGATADAERYVTFVAQASKNPADQFALADFYVAGKRFAEARAVLSAMTGGRAVASGVETRLARIDDAEGQPAAASERLDRVIAREPHHTGALLQRAQRALNRGEWEAALEDANAAIGANARLIGAHYVRASAQTRLRRYDEAMRSYTEIIRLSPSAADAKAALSRLHLARNVIDSAVLYAEEAVNASPNDIEARLALARAWVARGDDQRAASLVGQILATSSTAAEAHALDASLRLKRGDVAGARRAFERALQLDPRSVEALNALTQLDVREGRFAPARARLDAALEAAPEDADLIALAASVAFAAGDRPAADALSRRCIARDSLQFRCFGLLASVYQSEGRLDALVQEFDDRTRREPHPITARLVAAVAVHTAGDLAAAERRYERILRIERRTPLAANNLAAIYVERGTNLSYAELLALSALDQLPGSGEVLDTLGSIYARRTEHGPAIQHFSKAVAMEPGNAVFHYHLGQAYAASGDRDRAREALQMAVRLSHGFDAARDALTALAQ